MPSMNKYTKIEEHMFYMGMRGPAPFRIIPPVIPVEQQMYRIIKKKQEIACELECPICEAIELNSEVTRFDLLDFED